MSYDPFVVKLPSEEDLKKALLLLDLLVEDFRQIPRLSEPIGTLCFVASRF